MYNNDVVVHFTANDEVSGIDTLTPDIVISTEGASQSAIGTANDKAGNSASFIVYGINLDKTLPEITINKPANEYILIQIINAKWLAYDSLSGISSATGTTLNGGAIDTSSVGIKSYKVSAEDNAGNKRTATVTYYVGYNYDGVLQPIKVDGTSEFKLGSTIPVKFKLTDFDGNYVSTPVAKIYLTKITNDIIGTEIEATSTSAATTGNLFRYDSTANQYIFILGTKTLTSGTWQIRIALDDGSSKNVTIGLR